MQGGGGGGGGLRGQKANGEQSESQPARGLLSRGSEGETPEVARQSACDFLGRMAGEAGRFHISNPWCDQQIQSNQHKLF